MYGKIQPQVAGIKTSLRESIIVNHPLFSLMLASDTWNIPVVLLPSNEISHREHLEKIQRVWRY